MTLYGKRAILMGMVYMFNLFVSESEGMNAENDYLADNLNSVDQANPPLSMKSQMLANLHGMLRLRSAISKQPQLCISKQVYHAQYTIIVTDYGNSCTING